MVRPEVDVWLVRVGADEVTDDVVRRAGACLPPAERNRLGARAGTHRRRTLCANAALRVLAASAGAGALPLPALAPDALGRPVLRGPHQLQVSLSHAGDWAAVALTTAGPVGVDIEACEPLPDREPFARSILAPAELACWEGLSGPARDLAIARALTRKESVLKALGVGLAGGLSAVATDLRSAARGRVAVFGLPAAAGSPAGWTVRDLLAPPGFAASIAVRTPWATARVRRTTITRVLPRAHGPVRGAGRRGELSGQVPPSVPQP